MNVIVRSVTGRADGVELQEAVDCVGEKASCFVLWDKQADTYHSIRSKLGESNISIYKVPHYIWGSKKNKKNKAILYFPVFKK